MKRGSLLAAVALVLIATLAPFGAIPVEQMPARWCVVCGGLWLTDAISNVVLFVPLGVSLALLGVRTRRVLFTAALLSVLVEALQSVGVPPSRSPAIADVVANTVGGLLGMLFVRHAHILRATSRAATITCASYLTGTVAILVATSMALGPRSRSADVYGGGAESGAATVSYRVSPFDHTPGHGWFGGELDSATLNGFTRTQRGTGPIIVEASAEPASVRLSAWFRGADAGDRLVPLLFLHTAGDSSAVAFLAQDGQDARLVVTRTAWDWGLAMPSLLLRGAFRARRAGEASPMSLRATSTAAALELAGVSTAFEERASLSLTPVLGWAMIQTLVGVDSPLAALFTVGWLAALVAPIGWFAVRGRSPLMALAGAALVLAATVAALPRLLHVAPISPLGAALMVAMLALGALPGRASMSART